MKKGINNTDSWGSVNKGVYNPQDWTLEDFKEFCEALKNHSQNARPEIQIPYQLEKEFKKATLEYLKHI